MKILTEPHVECVGLTEFREHSTYKIPNDGDDSVKLCSFAAKGCYDSFGENGRPNQDNQSAVFEHRHGSVIEHYYVSLFIEGISRGLTLELNRHRPLNISQRSTRYTKEEDASIVLEPYYAALYRKYRTAIDQLDATGHLRYEDTGIVNFNHDEFQLIINHFRSLYDSFKEYKSEVDILMNLNPHNLEGFDLRKWARGKARNSLPHALETRATYTGNIRTWRWIIELRSERHAEAEIRRLMHHILKELRIVCPFYFSDFEITDVIEGIPEWKPKYSKV